VVSPSIPLETSVYDKKTPKSSEAVVESTPLSEAALAVAFKKANEKKARLAMLADSRRKKTAERKAEWANIINNFAKTDPQSLISKTKSEILQKEKDSTLERSKIQQNVNSMKTVSLDSLSEKRNAAVNDKSSAKQDTCSSIEVQHSIIAEPESYLNTGQEPKKPKIALQSRTSLALKSHQKPIVLKLVRADEIPQNSNLIEIRNVIQKQN